MKTSLFILCLLMTVILDCWGKEAGNLCQGQYLETDSTQSESIIHFEVKNSSTSYIVLNYSFNFITEYYDTLVVVNGICEKKYYLSKPVYMNISGTDFYGKIFLAPFYQLAITIDRNNRINGIVSFQYRGIGAIANNYLNAIKTANTPKFSQLGKILSEEKYVKEIENHYKILDSVYSIHLSRAAQTIEKEKFLGAFFKTEKTELRYGKGGRLLNFMANKKYKNDKAEVFFKQYIQPLDLQKEGIDLTSANSILFFNSYLLN